MVHTLVSDLHFKFPNQRDDARTACNTYLFGAMLMIAARADACHVLPQPIATFALPDVGVSASNKFRYEKNGQL